MSLYILEGLKPWVIQRVSAVYISLFLLYSLVCGMTVDVVSFDHWRNWLFHPFNSIAFGLFVVAVLFHAWIGMRDVILDYVHNIMLRMSVLALIVGVLVGCGLWVIRILLFSMVGQ
ncbi:MAG: succinate dehydrogenase, hydrophobic membrane anchor protein [Gammaproteobacteria bacterium]|nr:succinate dehydrogenase, hydrophobic membrane anchor protein [Gammaproteobacteria bacterium]